MAFEFVLDGGGASFLGASSGVERWSSPSNIALVKYWGKFADQIPANPSLSFTLDRCASTTSLEYRLRKDTSKVLELEFFFGGRKNDKFREKILVFFWQDTQVCPLSGAL